MDIHRRMQELIEAVQEAETAEEQKPKLGSGKRFQQLVKQLKDRGVRDPEALAAWIGRKKYGKQKFQKLAAQGRKESLDFAIQTILDEADLDIPIEAVLDRLAELDEEELDSVLHDIAEIYTDIVEMHGMDAMGGMDDMGDEEDDEEDDDEEDEMEESADLTLDLEDIFGDLTGEESDDDINAALEVVLPEILAGTSE